MIYFQTFLSLPPFTGHAITEEIQQKKAHWSKLFETPNFFEKYQYVLMEMKISISWIHIHMYPLFISLLWSFILFFTAQKSVYNVNFNYMSLALNSLSVPQKKAELCFFIYFFNFLDKVMYCSCKMSLLQYSYFLCTLSHAVLYLCLILN